MTLKDKVRQGLEASQETLAQAWASYERGELATAEPIVRAAFRRAFYCGALAAYLLTMSAVLPDAEAECEVRLELLSAEVDEAIKELGL